MAAKFIVLSLLVASVYGSGGYSSFSYGVSDPHTGDVKDQHEKRVGDSVVGKYSLLESDGTKRIVEYAANAATGFNAVVRKEPAVGVHPSGPHGPLVGAPHAHGPLAHPAPLAHRPGNPGLPHPAVLPSGAGPLGHPAHLATVGSLAHQSALAHHNAAAHSGALAHHGAVAHLKALAQNAALSHAGALAHHGALAHPGALAHSGPLAHPGALAHSGALAHPGALAHSGALAHPGALNHAGALTHLGALPQHGALPNSGAYVHPGALGHSGALNPLVNRHSGNSAYAGYAPFAANSYGNPSVGHLGARGAPAVSHYSHSIVHDAARPYPGPYAGAYNGAYGGAYGAYGHGAPRQHGAFGVPLAHGLANSLAHGLSSPQAHSYANSVSHPSPLGYGSYGAQGFGAGWTW